MHEDTFRASDVFLKRSRNSRAVSGSTESSRKATPMRSTTPSNEACDEGEVGPLVIEKKKGNYRKREREREKRGWEEKKRVKKSTMPCERRDLSSVTPDEPADDDEERGNARPEATFTVRRKRHATQPARRLCWPVNVPPLTVFSLFLVALIYGRYRWKYSPVRLLPSGGVHSIASCLTSSRICFIRFLLSSFFLKMID